MVGVKLSTQKIKTSFLIHFSISIYFFTKEKKKTNLKRIRKIEIYKKNNDTWNTRNKSKNKEKHAV